MCPFLHIIPSFLFVWTLKSISTIFVKHSVYYMKWKYVFFGVKKIENDLIVETG